MSSDDINSKLDKLLKNDDTENFYSFVSEIIEENKEYVSDLEQNLNLIYKILIADMNESNHESKMAFICLFFEILISENIDFTLYLDKLLNLIIQTNIYSDENIKRIINICSNATLSKTTLYKKLINFAKNKVEYLYIIFSLAGFKDIIIDTLSENWELIFDLMNSQEVKLNSTDIKNVLKCLELLINLSEDKFKPFASSALYQALDYLSETDIELQKRSLMIIYSLSKFCDEQLQPLSEHIVDFLKVLEKGKNVEINNLCNTMLKHFTGNEENEIEENENENENRNDNVEENEEIENDDIDNENNIIDNDDYPENKDNQEEHNEQIEQNEQNQQNQQFEQNERNLDLNEVDDTKPEYSIKNNTNNNISEEYDYNYEKRPKPNMQNNIEINREQQKEKYMEYQIKPKENNREIYENQNNIEAYPKKIYSNKKENKIQMNKYKQKPKEEYEDNNEQMNQEIENSNDNDNNNDNFYNIDIDAIMKKIKDLSNKQIIILNSIEQYKSDTERIINQKKIKIKSLEEKIEDLEEKIRIEKNKRKNRGVNPGRTNYQMRRKNNNDNNSYKNKYENEDDDEYNDYYRYGK